MSTMTQDLTLRQSQELALEPAPDSFAQMFERLATNADVDVAKLERLITMHERILDRNAEAEFNAAFATMQAQIPAINEKGKTDKGKYAKLEDIIDTVRPILKAHGFSLSFKTEWPSEKRVKVTGILTHSAGHQRTSEFLSDADTSGSKNGVQAFGSAISYGRRYTTTDLLSIVSREQDDDARTAEHYKAPEAPAGFDDWCSDMETLVKDGCDWKTLSANYEKSPQAFRDYAVKHHNAKLVLWKESATKVTNAARAAAKGGAR